MRSYQVFDELADAALANRPIQPLIHGFIESNRHSFMHDRAFKCPNTLCVYVLILAQNIRYLSLYFQAPIALRKTLSGYPIRDFKAGSC